MNPCIDLDIDGLLKPFEDSAPSGSDLRYTEIYDQIKAARRSDDNLSRGEWQIDVKSADWKEVIDLCRQALTHRSKDLQIAAWLTEAMVHQCGYQGLATGLLLITQLMESFWATLYPPIDGDDLDYRVGPMMFLNEKIPDALFDVPVCDPLHSKGYGHFAWEASRIVGFNQNLDKEQQERREILIQEGKVTGEEFTAAVNASSISFYKTLMDQLEQCRQNLLSLDAVTNRKFSPDPPGFSKLESALNACYYLVGKIYKEKQKSEVLPQEDMNDHPAQPEEELMTDGPIDEPFEQDIHPCTNNGEHAISDISVTEKQMWRWVTTRLKKGDLKSALDQLLAAASLAPSVREKNRFHLLLAKLCLKANRPDLARPIVEKLYALIETLKLEQWEHPAWIAEVIETLYRCLGKDDESQTQRARELFEKLCTLNITKAAVYRMD
jgi:type VI secretion system protein ImpA